jgi:PIN domain nuclease of toxin-antitoxin system
MKYLLDTHTFVWWDMEASRLSAKVFDILADDANELFLSVASVWEIQIKQQIGKLKLPAPLPEVIERQQTDNEIVFLPVTLPHVFDLNHLPLHHRDPFDRLLVAQARVENLILLSDDAVFAQYPVQVVW